MNQSPLISSFQPTAPVGAPVYRRVDARRWLPLLASLVLVACAAVPTGKPEDIVRQRATERWQALAAGDFAKAYAYSTPGFKAVVAADAFRLRFGNASWYGAEVIKVDCPEPTQCTARVRIDMKYLLSNKPGNNKISTHVDEVWLLEDGQWWMFQKI